MSEIIETAKVGTDTFRLRIEPDQDPMCPRTQYDNLAHVITLPDQNYIDVDQDPGPLAEGWNRLHRYDDADRIKIFTRWARAHGAVVVEHSGGEMAHSLWYMLPAAIAEVPDAEAAIRQEIAEYLAWAVGEVYGYVIEQAVEWVRRDGAESSMTTWEQVEDGSCWGLIGYDYAMTEAREQFRDYTEGIQ
jgi:hypothetical protein